jgi:tRNA-dihydrouridine synthase A
MDPSETQHSLRLRPSAADPWRLSVAPMMDRTDRHCRYFLRLVAPGVRLYTEMITAAAIVRGPAASLLRFDPAEHPVALQLGGNDPAMLATAAALAAAEGYDEVNLNVGCPSDRVSVGAFGACLMQEPALVARCVAAMAGAMDRPVTVKTRIGINDRDDYGFLREFVDTVAGAGCGTFIIHARKAILGGLSPSENRSIPPLRPEVVYRLKADFPSLRIIINGGVDNLALVEQHLAAGLDGVMIGRKAYADPYSLAALEARFLRPNARWQPLAREAIVAAMAHYAEGEIGQGARLHHVTRHMLGLYHGEPGARAWRRYLSGAAARPGAAARILLESLACVGAGPRYRTPATVLGQA